MLAGDRACAEVEQAVQVPAWHISLSRSAPAPSTPAQLCRYDPTSNRWLPGPPLQRKRFALGGAAMDGAIYAVRAVGWGCVCTMEREG